MHNRGPAILYAVLVGSLGCDDGGGGGARRDAAPRVDAAPDASARPCMDRVVECTEDACHLRIVSEPCFATVATCRAGGGCVLHRLQDEPLDLSECPALAEVMSRWGSGEAEVADDLGCGPESLCRRIVVCAR